MKDNINIYISITQIIYFFIKNTYFLNYLKVFIIKQNKYFIIIIIILFKIK
jgi:hypothetical protein